MPPLDTSKKLVPKSRSIMSSTSAIVIAGKARTIRNEVKSVIQVKTGRRIIVMPGARMLMIVTMKLSAAGDRGDAEQLQAHDPQVDRSGRG